MMMNKPKSEYLKVNCCFREFAYREDTNYPTRQQMEDAHFYIDNVFNDQQSALFAVLDGHGGIDVVEFVTKVLPETFIKDFKSFNPQAPLEYFESIFKKVDDQLKFLGASDIGSTCCLALIRARTLYIANLGDTRAVMNFNNKAVRLSVDHKSNDPDEQMRVKREGGCIVRNRVSGQLAVTRAFGDLDLKTQGVSVKPDLKVLQITDDVKYVILASDGLWDVVSDEQAIELTKNCKSAEEMTKILLQTAVKTSKDNISILIVTF